MEEERTTEVQDTSTQVNDAGVHRQMVRRTATEVSGIVFAQRLIWFIVGVIDALIAIRFVLLLLGANHAAGFVDFIYGITNFLVAPFTGIFGQPSYGVSVFEVSSLLAIIIYTLIGYGLVKLITLGRPRAEV